ncbi:MAG: hypothetical protein JXA90_09355 [Planctomycetes bacterium]|nr:hypothetical protein [Planctomycetota bacterium]
MSHLPPPNILLVGGFLAAIASVGASQALVALIEGEGPRVAPLLTGVPSAARVRAFESDLEESSWLARRLRPWAQSLRFSLLREMGDDVVPGRDGWLFYRPSVRYLVEPWPGHRDGLEGSIVSAIAAFRDDLAARGVRMLLVLAPNKASIYPDRLSRRADAVAAVVHDGTLSVIARLRALGIEVVDLFSVFETARRRAEPVDGGRGIAAELYYLGQDSHWSPPGVRLAAAAVARRLLDLGWVERGEAEYALKESRVQRTGDLLRMVRVESIEQSFEPEAFQALQVVDAVTAVPYRDDPGSTVLVIGDSFLRIYSQEDPGAGGLVAHMARELRLPLSSLVSDGGGATLIRQTLSRKPTLLAGRSVVVWEFAERDIRFAMEGWPVVRLR